MAVRAQQYWKSLQMAPLIIICPHVLHNRIISCMHNRSRSPDQADTSTLAQDTPAPQPSQLTAPVSDLQLQPQYLG